MLILLKLNCKLNSLSSPPPLTVRWRYMASARTMRPSISVLLRTVPAPRRPVLASPFSGPTGCPVCPPTSRPTPSHLPPSRCRGGNRSRTLRTSSVMSFTSAGLQVSVHGTQYRLAQNERKRNVTWRQCERPWQVGRDSRWGEERGNGDAECSIGTGNSNWKFFRSAFYGILSEICHFLHVQSQEWVLREVVLPTWDIVKMNTWHNIRVYQWWRLSDHVFPTTVDAWILVFHHTPWYRFIKVIMHVNAYLHVHCMFMTVGVCHSLLESTAVLLSITIRWLIESLRGQPIGSPVITFPRWHGPVGWGLWLQSSYGWVSLD